MSRVLVVLALVLVAAAPAHAASRGQILDDCADDGRLQGTYSPSELRDARHNLPSHIAEYTDCAALLRSAELPDRRTEPAVGGGGAGTPSSPPPPPATPAGEADRAEIARAAKTGGRPVTVGGTAVVPGAAGLNTHAVHNPLPAVLALALALLAVPAAAGLARGRYRA